MSTITVADAAPAASKLRARPRARLLRRVFGAIIESRTREARRMIANRLAAMGDQQLADLGFSGAEMKSIRRGEPVSNILARRAGQMT